MRVKDNPRGQIKYTRFQPRVWRGIARATYTSEVSNGMPCLGFGWVFETRERGCRDFIRLSTALLIQQRSGSPDTLQYRLQAMRPWTIGRVWLAF